MIWSGWEHRSQALDSEAVAVSLVAMSGPSSQWTSAWQHTPPTPAWSSAGAGSRLPLCLVPLAASPTCRPGIFHESAITETREQNFSTHRRLRVFSQRAKPSTSPPMLISEATQSGLHGAGAGTSQAARRPRMAVHGTPSISVDGKLQRRKQRRQSLAEWQRKRNDRRRLSLPHLPAVPSTAPIHLI